MAQPPSSGVLMLQRFADVYIVEFMQSSLLDQATIQKISDELNSVVERMGHPKLIISFENVIHVSSSMLGVLINVQKKAKGGGGEVRLAKLPPTITELFKVTNLNKMFAIFDNADKAMVKF
jgi:anti-anti-sigma factor